MPDEHIHSNDNKSGFSTITEQDQDIKEPSLYHVILLNDDYTTMEFVVQIIKGVFGRTDEEASRIMLEVHSSGQGIAGTYMYDIARSKVEKVMYLAFKKNFPLKCILQEV